VDDDGVSRLIIEKFVAKTGMLKLIASCDSAIDAAKILRQADVDIIFLDVEMPGLTGLDLIKSLRNVPSVVLITGKKEYAAEAFEFDVEDYILKPVEYPRFLKAVMKVTESLSRKTPVKDEPAENLFIKVDQKFISINSKDILFSEAQKDYVKVVTPAAKYVTLSTMKGVESKLPAKDFIRIHRSYIVRIDKISDLKSENLLIGKEIIPIGESYKHDLFKRLNIL